jgi:phosphoribosylformylglycinamidine synthase subunit PurSL
MAVMDDINKAITMDCKQAGNLVYIVGNTYDELGGSHYYAVNGFTGNKVPQVRGETSRKTMAALSSAVQKGLVKSCHDLSEGGIGVAAAEMAFAGGLGMSIDLKNVPLGEAISRDDNILFSESNSRFLVEVTPSNQKVFEQALSGTDFARIGKVTKGTKLEVTSLKGAVILSADIADLKEAWQKPLSW